MSLILDGSAGVTFPSGSGTQAAQSKVLQVVQGTFNGVVSSSSSTFADVGLSASITPLFSTSKILVMVTLEQCEKNTSSTSMKTQLLRGASVIAYMTDAAGYNGASTSNVIGTISINYLDSPATTSSTTYKVQFASQANTNSVVIGTTFGGGSGVCTMTLMEIAQ